jgi:NAD(P)-dependent dehydrogenase (short-subunit alcohol dehydrogenase family)
VGELDGRAALVTGATTGLGFAIARAFLREGASVVITGRNPELGRQAQVELRRDGEATFVRADAADVAAVERSTDRAVELLGGIDILVNNAGIGVAATLLDTPVDDLDAVMAVNVRGYFAYARACFAQLRIAGGCMIHVGSDAGVLGEVDIGAYSVSKAAVHMMSNMLAIEAGRMGVRSNVIAPGDTEPGMRHMAPPGDRDRAEADPSNWSLVPPVGRFGRADDVAEAAVYLASPRASFVNGVVLTLDGGMRAGLNTGLPPRAP